MARKKKAKKIGPDKLNWQRAVFFKRGPGPRSKTGFRGVTDYPNGRFYTIVRTPAIGKNKKIVGSFKTVREAAKRYDEYMLETYGDWVYTNFKPNGRRNVWKPVSAVKTAKRKRASA